ncbi:hypothetical protein H6P81_014430 [Aristolochia fimbriata]|uniref:Uncharacterized protein n=1 Tax=Aristolochia fimbriata TaxID=158543 RepID=A0AAV7EL48_ARIFI|nr:hypothetical protein H6P81_014430 [Aristolochia fimbriata]
MESEETRPFFEWVRLLRHEPVNSNRVWHSAHSNSGNPTESRVRSSSTRLIGFSTKANNATRVWEELRRIFYQYKQPQVSDFLMSSAWDGDKKENATNSFGRSGNPQSETRFNQEVPAIAVTRLDQ